MTAKEHNKMLGILHLIDGGLQLFVGIFMPLLFWIMYQNIMQVAPPETVAEQDSIISFLLVAGGIFLALVFVSASINLIAGWKMLKEKSGARAWGIVASIVCLPNIPFGTVIGVYGLWFLFGVEGRQIYRSEKSN